jgi:predicted metal-binding protein
MKEAVLKSEIDYLIGQADANQLEEIYGWLTNYFTDDHSLDNWDTMPEPLKQKIDKRIPAKEAIQKIREKYGLND